MTQTWQTECHDREITDPARPLVLQKILPQVQSVVVKTWFPALWSHCCEVRSADGRVSSYLSASQNDPFVSLAGISHHAQNHSFTTFTTNTSLSTQPSTKQIKDVIGEWIFGVRGVIGVH
jgi:hypothetical protein